MIRNDPYIEVICNLHTQVEVLVGRYDTVWVSANIDEVYKSKAEIDELVDEYHLNIDEHI